MKKSLTNAVIISGDASQAKKVLKAVPSSRAADFFIQFRKVLGDYDNKYRRRIMALMGKYLESEDEKRINYLKRKLLQWRDNAKNSTKESARIRLVKRIERRSKLEIAKDNWTTLADKYDIYVNKLYLYQFKSRLRTWLKWLIDFSEKLRGRFTTDGRVIKALYGWYERLSTFLINSKKVLNPKRF